MFARNKPNQRFLSHMLTKKFVGLRSEAVEGSNVKEWEV
jgi:hypothetical protein